MSESHHPRLNYFAKAPDLYNKLAEITAAAHGTGLDPLLVLLVEFRASQINGCAFCIDMHAKQARMAGERELRLYAVTAWRESALFSPRERAALRWTEALTTLKDGVPDEEYAAVREHFDEAEVAKLSAVIVIINTWNRLGVGFRSVPGSLDKAYGLDKSGLE